MLYTHLAMLPAPCTQAELHKILDYDPLTGVFRWKVRRSIAVLAGAIAGSQNRDGYRRIVIDGKGYGSHRFAWFWVTGVWPENEIDHENGVPGDDWFTNLRPATPSQNQGNSKRRAGNASGLKGASFHKVTGRYQASIKIGRKSKHLGLFDTPEEAHAAYISAAQRLFGDYSFAGERP